MRQVIASMLSPLHGRALLGLSTCLPAPHSNPKNPKPAAGVDAQRGRHALAERRAVGRQVVAEEEGAVHARVHLHRRRPEDDLLHEGGPLPVA